MTTTTTTNQVSNVFVTPIQAAKVLGKQPQVIYGWIRTGKLDDTILKVDSMSNKPFVHLENLQTWMASRPARATGGSSVQIKQKPEELLQMMIGWFTEAGQDGLAADLQKVFDKHNAPTSAEEVK